MTRVSLKISAFCAAFTALQRETRNAERRTRLAKATYLSPSPLLCSNLSCFGSKKRGRGEPCLCCRPYPYLFHRHALYISLGHSLLLQYSRSIIPLLSHDYHHGIASASASTSTSTFGHLLHSLSSCPIPLPSLSLGNKEQKKKNYFKPLRRCNSLAPIHLGRGSDQISNAQLSNNPPAPLEVVMMMMMMMMMIMRMRMRMVILAVHPGVSFLS